MKTNHKPTEFKIETGIPIPGWNLGRKRPKYPFAGLKLLQSFFVPTKCSSYASVAVAASLFKKYNKGYVFTVKKATKNGVIGTRVWRIPVGAKGKK